MGTYINLGNAGFQRARNSEYIDKSELITVINQTLFTEQSFSCVSRCRRFGKSLAAKMLCAYYDRSCDSRHLFKDLTISHDPTFEKHLNKYPVIYLDLTNFVSQKESGITEKIDAELLADISRAYPEIDVEPNENLSRYLLRIAETKQQQFIFIIDEWDAICREYEPGTKEMDLYIDWLRKMFKSADAIRTFAGVYMTGILPIKKYKTQSAIISLNILWLIPVNFRDVLVSQNKKFIRFAKNTRQTLRKWKDGMTATRLEMSHQFSIRTPSCKHYGEANVVVIGPIQEHTMLSHRIFK